MPRRFSRPVLAALDAAKILGVRSGTGHKFTGVWPVVVDGRLYARSWGVSRDGWYHAFLENANGAIQIGDREIRVRAVPAKSERVRDKVEAAYASKFTTPASRKWVRGFKSPRRRGATVEFVPR